MTGVEVLQLAGALCTVLHYGHSQVDILNPEPSVFPNYVTDGAWVAEVGPGDMLVVPSFWFHRFHHMETLEQSVSVNVWSDAPEHALLNHIYEQPIPFEESYIELTDLATATKIYIEMHYEPVVLSGNLNVSDKASQEVRKFCSSVQWEKEKSWLIPLLRRGISLLEPLFALITTRATLEICLGNYVEHLVHHAIGLDNVV